MSSQAVQEGEPEATESTVEEEAEGKGKETVSSTAIVQYKEAEPPTLPPYAQLQQDTDLKVAPENWLRDGRFSNIYPRQSYPVTFSSFGMAHSFPDVIENVDVISDAENIKKLLKIPYSKAEVSLAVHKVGRTLLFDEIDIPGLIPYASQRNRPQEFEWLYKLYREQAGIPQGTEFARKKKKNKDQMKQREIFSKFLHHSIGVDSQHVECESPLSGSANSAIPKDASKDAAIPVVPLVTETFLPEPQQSSPFQRHVEWTFEDLHMLVGSNMPIFGGGKWPAVSLRLRECGKPINVLTGLDTWLDNLMCNVPEVAMCYHLDGIVQYYDLFKTEDLPSMEGSQFSPIVIKDIAQNMLSFMKANCTQEGHTYWLFKGSDDDVVKLYDLTSICGQTQNEEEKNPFTIPVAMLLYRVAKNMMRGPLDVGDQGTVRMLLGNCLGLLEKEAFPEIVTSANYLLSALYSPDDVHTLPALLTGQPDTSEGPAGRETPASPGDGLLAVPSTLQCLEVAKLSTPGSCEDVQCAQIPQPLPRNVEERCKEALSHIVKGLSPLKMACAKEQEQEEGPESSSSSSAPLAAGGPHSPVALSFRTVEARPCGDPGALVPSLTDSSEAYGNQNVPQLVVVRPANWQTASLALLLHKAGAVYHSLACWSNNNGKYGRALRFCKLSLKSLEGVRSLQGDSKERDRLLASVLCAAGVAHLMLAKSQGNTSVHFEDFKYLSADDQVIAHYAEDCARSSPVELMSAMIQFISDKKKSLLKSEALYQAALDATPEAPDSEQATAFSRHLGNVKNELGVFVMNQAASLMAAGAEPTSEQRQLWDSSISCFSSGIRVFEAIQDRANMALLLSNCGRLMRLCAQAVGGRYVKGTTSRGEFSQEEKGYFNKAFEFYNRALRSLYERKTFPEVWDTVTWELSGAYFSMATLLQDYAPLSVYAQERVEQEVTELMMKALRLCEPTGAHSTAQVKAQSEHQLEYRIGTIHHRLASLYHNSYRNQVADQTKKKVRSLAERHYSKATAYFRPDRDPCQWIRIQLERVAMCEYHVSQYGGTSGALRILQTALEYILSTRNALEAIAQGQEEANGDKLKENPGEDMSSSNGDSLKRATSDFVKNELRSLFPILESRLTGVLKEMLRICTQKKVKAHGGSDSPNADYVKRMYSAVLRASGNPGQQQDIRHKCTQLVQTFQTLEEIKMELS